MLRAGILVALYTFTNSALADACMLESTQKNFPNKSCMQNAGLPLRFLMIFVAAWEMKIIK